MKADFAFSPAFMPSPIPAPRATMFLSAPESSTPKTSSLVYTRKLVDISMVRDLSAASGFWLAMTVEAGLPAIISLARLGPDSTHTLECRLSGSSSWITWLIRRAVGSSNPLVALRVMTPRFRCGLICWTFSLSLSDGTARITNSLFFKASAGQLVMFSPFGNGTFGKNLVFRPSETRVCASVWVRVSMVTGMLFWANNMPRVVPQVVVPMMAA